MKTFVWKNVQADSTKIPTQKNALNALHGAQNARHKTPINAQLALMATSLQKTDVNNNANQQAHVKIAKSYQQMFMMLNARSAIKHLQNAWSVSRSTSWWRIHGNAQVSVL